MHSLLILRNLSTVPHIQIYEGCIRNQISNIFTMILRQLWGIKITYPKFVYLSWNRRKEYNNLIWEVTKRKFYRPFVCQTCFKISVFFSTQFKKIPSNKIQGPVLGLPVTSAHLRSSSRSHILVCSWCCPLAASGREILSETRLLLFTETHPPTGNWIFVDLLWEAHMLDHKVDGLFTLSAAKHFWRASPHFSLSQASILPVKEEF